MPILLLALLPVPRMFTGESPRADEAQRQMIPDIQRTIFDLLLAPLQQVVQEGTVMDCADSKTRLWFPILSAWIADHAEHEALNRIGSKSYPKCKVSCKEFVGNPLKMYGTSDYLLLGTPRMSTHKAHAQAPAYQSVKTDEVQEIHLGLA